MDRIIPTHAGKSGFLEPLRVGGGVKPLEPLSQNTLKKMEDKNMNHESLGGYPDLSGSTTKINLFYYVSSLSEQRFI